ncbi:DUF1433 domain-containing protein [Bacillus sp. RAR_GA_16]|uniref:DUF1433 domain-containing protein n=1 Tax=Bacillus sp. RAR_GA_16 TaxID=2876774 RepID=UPI001CCE7C9C|nr:DUF1433 domain-containing protein [Bacillus sp. RAR_GA_16]MCA0172131.1 DUF1433 domain-containing protein [Bacillus sp. RAR_GA_16]
MKYLSLIAILLAFSLGACNVNSVNSSNERYDQEFIAKAKDKAEQYIRNNYNGVETVEFSNDHSSPMGNFALRGTVNGEAKFEMDISQSFFIGGISEGDGFPKIKEECIEVSCE